MDPPTGEARDRILRTAYQLFRDRGFQATGVDRIVAEAGVAKTTLYRHFASKDDLGIAALELRERLWTWDWLAREIERRARTPAGRLLAIFDAFDDWFRGADFEGCLFINALVEARDRTRTVGAASVRGMANVQSLVREQAEAAGANDPDAFARGWQILMSGAIIAATAGDLGAALRARELAVVFLEHEGLDSQ